MRDVRQRQSGKPCSPESRSDAGQSSPVCGPEARDGSPGAETPCQQGRVPSRGPRGDSASGPFPPRRGVRSPRPMAPVCVFKASCLAPRAPLCAAGPCLQPLVVAPGPPARPRPLFVFGGRPSSNLSSARDHTPPRRVTSQSRVPERRTWTFRGAVILPNSPSISQGNMFWIYLGACRKSFFYS